MYQPPFFKEDRIHVMHELMHGHPFATLITTQNNELSADHIPMLIHPELSDKGTIRAHIAKANPIYRNQASSKDVLVIFQGPHTYITPNWYASKKEHGKVVPTWNYAVVHAKGELAFFDDKQWIMNHLVENTSRREKQQAQPWKVSDAPADFIQQQINSIVGIEIVIRSIEGKWKASQNKNDKDRDSVKQGLLNEQLTDTVATLVRQRDQ